MEKRYVKDVASDIAELVMDMYYEYLVENKNSSDKYGYKKLYKLTMDFYIKTEEYERCKVLKELLH
ncbi:hypothetical protein M0Q50_01950 [bacterium]|jgi:hypothetical protein|nr:hypothetical protein [bacterium]